MEFVKLRTYLPLLILIVYAAIMTVLAFVANGTGDEGDSVSHFLFANYAFRHPENFFNHWAKPVYVMLAAPFAQFGFVGVKLMNLFFSLVSAWLVYLTARRLSIPFAWAGILLALLAPMQIYLTLSGLTEPLFAVWLMASVYLAVRHKMLVAVILVSFLPFVRSEGLAILCVWGSFLLFSRWRWMLPLLMTGHLVYSILGYFYFGDLLWVFNKIPYSTTEPVYGSGELLHFVNGLQEVVGTPIYILIGIGILYGLFWLFFSVIHLQYINITAQELWLIYGGFAAIIVAHTLFWYLGIFASFGLLRVLICIVPLAAIIGLRGLNALLRVFGRWPLLLQAVMFIAILLVLLFPLSKLKYQTHFMLRGEQLAQKELSGYVLARYHGYKYYFDAPYLSLTLKADIFDPSQKEHTDRLFQGKPVPDKSLVIWDDWYSPKEARTSLPRLMQDDRFKLIRSFESPDPWGNPRIAYLFIKRQYNSATDSTGRPAKRIFETGFEEEGRLSTENTDSIYAFEGKYSTKADATTPYSKGMDLPFTEIQPFKTGAVLQVNAQVFFSKKETDRNREPLLLISFENEKSYSWNKLKLQEVSKTGVWQKVNFQAEIPPQQTPVDRVKVYIFNPSEETVYMDNLTVDIIE